MKFKKKLKLNIYIYIYIYIILKKLIFKDQSEKYLDVLLFITTVKYQGLLIYINFLYSFHFKYYIEILLFLNLY